jgi:hypothetical protein
MFKYIGSVAVLVLFSIILILSISGTASAAWEDLVQGELKPVENINWSEIDPPKPEYVMPESLQDEVKSFVAGKFGVEINDVIIEKYYNYNMPVIHEPITFLGLFVQTNFCYVHYDHDTKKLLVVNKKIEPGIEIETARGKATEELKKEGILSDTDVLYDRYGELLDKVKLIMEYRQRDDYNFYPIYRTFFYAFKSDDANGARYEMWHVQFDPDTMKITGENKRLERTFANIKTPDAVIEFLKSKEIFASLYEVTISAYSEIPEWEIRCNPNWGHFEENGTLTFITDKRPPEGSKIYYVMVDERSNIVRNRIIESFDYNGIFPMPSEMSSNGFTVYVSSMEGSGNCRLFLSDNGEFVARNLPEIMSGNSGVDNNSASESVQQSTFGGSLIYILIVVVLVVGLIVWRIR